MNHKVYRILPVFEERMWGGTKLIERYHFDTDMKKLAEVYCVIAIPGHLDCKVEETGEFLSEFYKSHPEVFACDAEDMPVRLVLGSSEQSLSVQIHPEDAYGLEHSGMRGKHEGELILDGSENGSMILGHYAKTREEFIELAEKKEWDKLFRHIHPKKNDYIHIPYNTLHGSEGSGMIVAFSTNGDVTYRLYDYDRIDPATGELRQLHVKDVYANVICPCDNIGAVDYNVVELDGCQISRFFDEPGLYSAGRIIVEDTGVYQQDEFLFLTCLNGSGYVAETEIKAGQTILIPAGYGSISIKGPLDLAYISYRNRKA